MPEKEKKSSPADKKALAEKESSDSSKVSSNIAEAPPESNFSDQLAQAVKDLWYMSETDAEVKVFTGEKTAVVTKDSLAGS